MQINKFTKKSGGLYELTFEDNHKLLIHEDLILKYDLLIRKKIDSKKEAELLKENNNYLAYSKAIKYIGIKMRSILEVKKYLNKQELDEEYINVIINKLISQGYLNDLEYAEAYVNDRINLSNDGPKKIYNELIKLGIDDSDIDIALTSFTIDIAKEKINKLIIKYIKLNNNKGANLLKRKIIENLTNLGYDRNISINELDNYQISDDDIYKKEYEKYKAKLEKKYSGKELEYRIKQKMYQKGFDIN